MVLRGEQIQRCGPGECSLLTSHTLIRQTAKFHSDFVHTCAWSGACESPCFSWPGAIPRRADAISNSTLIMYLITYLLKGGRYVVPLQHHRHH